MATTPFSLTDGDEGLLTGLVGSRGTPHNTHTRTLAQHTHANPGSTAVVPRSASKKRLRPSSSDPTASAPSDVVSVSVLRRQVEEAQLLRERDVQSHRLELRQAEAQIEKLKRQVKFLGVEEETLRGRLARKERKWLEEKQALEDHSDSLAKKLRSCDADCDELRATLAETTAQVDRLNSMLDARSAQLSEVSSSQADSLSRLQADLKTATEQASRVPVLEERLASSAAELERLQGQIERQKTNAGGASGVDVDVERDMRKMREQVHVCERKERAAHSELKRLQSQQRNTELLERKLASATRRAEESAGEVTRLSVLEVKMKALVAEKARWAESFKQILSAETSSTSSSTPHTVQGMELTPDLVLAVVRGLQDQRLDLLSEKGAAEAAAAAAGRSVDVHQRRVKELETELAASEDKRIAAEERSLRLDRRCQLAQREKQSLKNVLETYRLEEEAGGRPSDKDKDTDQDTDMNKDKTATSAKDTLIAHLETSLAAATAALSKYDSEEAAGASPAVTSNVAKRAAAMSAELEEATSKIARLTKALDKVETENAALMSRVAKGDFNPATTKVVHLAMNPTTVALKKEEDGREERIKVLEKEVASLQAKLEGEDDVVGGGGGGGGEGGGALVDTKELDALRLRHQRLKEVFRDKIATFREAVYLLTGYKVDMTVASASSLTQLRLKSMYAEQETDYLLFHLKDGRLELLGTDFCKRIDKKIFAYLTTCHSIPAFLSNVTLDLFEKQTFLG